MGTFWEIEVIDEDEEKAKESIEKAFSEIKRIEGLLSRFNPESEISRINRAAARNPVPVSEEVFALVRLGADCFRLTDGAFDITITPFLSLWELAEQRNVFPSKEEIGNRKSLIGAENIVTDQTHKTIFLKKEGVNIDLGGVGKGYAIDCSIKVLKEQKIEEAMVNAGGEIFVLGGEAHSILGIRNPWRPQEIIGSAKIKDQALSTSANYERGYRVGDKSFGHIINPTTGYPEEQLQSVSVIAKTATEADIFSTSVFVMGTEKSKILVEENNSLDGLMILSGSREQDKEVFICGAAENFNCR